MNYTSLEALRDAMFQSELQTISGAQIVFVPEKGWHDEQQMLQLYSRLKGNEYDTIVFLETHIKQTDKKIPMPTFQSVNTQFGEIQINDIMRNEFCDEDDDFFIDDHALTPDMELYHHLPYLQAVLGEFRVVSVQICDEDPSIVREVTYVLSEIMAGRNALLVVSCAAPGNLSEMDIIKKLVADREQSNIMNYLNGGDVRVSGAAGFQAGVFVGYNWDLEFEFMPSTQASQSAIAGYAFSNTN